MRTYLTKVEQIALFLLLVLISSGCQQEDQPVPALIEVNGQTVSKERFVNDFNASLRGEDLNPPEAKTRRQRQFMAALVNRILIEQEAARLHIIVSPAEIEAAIKRAHQGMAEDAFQQMLAQKNVSRAYWRQQLGYRLLLQKVMKRLSADRVKVTDEEVRQHYEARRERYRRPLRIRARQLVVATKEQGQWALQRLQSGVSFGRVAREMSLSPDAETGGKLGLVARGQLPPEFDAALFALEPGQLSDLVQTPYGWHIFMVEEKIPARQLTLDEVKQPLREQLKKKMAEEVYQRWHDDLRSRAKITIRWPLLNETP